MRLIRICTNYPAYLDAFYGARPGLRDAPHADQAAELAADCFGWADYWTNALSPLGYEVWEPVGNAEPAQKAWARENGVPFGERTWLTDIVAAQVKRFRPDVLFANDFRTYGRQFVARLREECPSIRLVIGWCASPHDGCDTFAAYDVVLSSIPAYVDGFRRAGHRAEFFRHAFEPRVLERIGPASGDPVPFSFIGSVVKGPGFHSGRERLLLTLLRETELAAWLEFQRASDADRRGARLGAAIWPLIDVGRRIPGGPALLSRLPVVRDYAGLAAPPDPSRFIAPELQRAAKPALFGRDMFRRLRDSRVTLNVHGDNSAERATNMKLYEATGVGTCLLTERQPGLAEAFVPDAEVATYGSPGEAVEKARYLLAHEDARRAVAQAGQRRTLRDHTFGVRARRLDEIVRETVR